jgi:hypothetical protein
MSRRSSAAFPLLMACLLVFATTARGDDAPRTWRDSSGKHEVVATLVRQTSDAVVLRTQEGRQITIPLAKLSAADRTYLATRNDDNPFAVPATAAESRAAVIVHASHGEQQRFGHGVVFLTRQDTTYVISSSLRFLVDGKWVDPDDVTILQATDEGEKRVAAKRLVTFGSEQQTVYAAPAAALQPAPVGGPMPERLPASVRIAGCRINLHAVPPIYERIGMTATLVGISRDQKGTPLTLSGSTENLEHVRNALLVDDDDRVLGLISGGNPQNPARPGTGPWTFQATAFARLPDRLRPELSSACKVVPVSGDRRQTEYELVIYVTDPLHQVRSPTLRVYDCVELTSVGLAAPKDKMRTQKPIEVEVKIGEPSEAARRYLPAHEQAAANARVYIGRLTRKHGGVLMPHAFQVELVDHDEDRKETVLGGTIASFDFGPGSNPNVRLPDLPGVDGLPIDMPRPVKLPQGGWRLTSDATQVTPQSATSRPAAYPTPEASGTKLAGEVKRVGDGYGLVELALNNVSKAGSRGRGPAAFSADGAWLYFIDSNDQLYKISTKTFKAERTLKLGAECDHVAMSKAGLVVPLHRANLVWVLDPETLAVRREMQATGVRLAVGAPSTNVGFLLGSISDNTSPIVRELTMVDLSTGRALHAIRNVYTSRSQAFPLTVEDKPLFGDSVFCMRMPDDGTYLFLADKQLTRLRIDGTDLVYEQKSPILGDGHTTHAALSGDGKRIAMPTGGGGYCIAIFDAVNMDTPRLSLDTGAYPSAVAFDPPSQNMFASDSHNIISFAPRGGRIASFNPGDSDLSYLLMHPAGGRFVIFGNQKVYYCDTLENRLRDDLILARP